MNNLARLNEVKADEAGVAGISDLDSVLGRAVEEVSREFEGRTGRTFSAKVATRYFTGHRRCPLEIYLPFDAASITSLKWDEDGDGDYEITLVENTDFFAYRETEGDVNTPIYRLEINPNGTQISRWPTAPRALEMVCLEGYSYELEATGLTLSGNINDAVTSLTASTTAAALIFAGDTLVLDSEQMEVVSVATAAITVRRAINGTTAATHTTGAALSIRRYPRDVERVVAERVVGMRWDTQGGYASAVTLTGESTGARGTTTIRGSYARWESTIRAFKRFEVK